MTKVSKPLTLHIYDKGVGSEKYAGDKGILKQIDLKGDDKLVSIIQFAPFYTESFLKYAEDLVLGFPHILSSLYNILEMFKKFGAGLYKISYEHDNDTRGMWDDVIKFGVIVEDKNSERYNSILDSYLVYNGYGKYNPLGEIFYPTFRIAEFKFYISKVFFPDDKQRYFTVGFVAWKRTDLYGDMYAFIRSFDWNNEQKFIFLVDRCESNDEIFYISRNKRPNVYDHKIVKMLRFLYEAVEL